jgi:hypothetical protein
LILKNIHLIDSDLCDLFVKKAINYLELQKKALPLHPLSERGRAQI